MLKVPQDYNLIYLSLWLVFGVELTVIFDLQFGINLPLIRYLLCLLAVIFWIIGIRQTSKFSIYPGSYLFRSLRFIFIAWLLVTIIRGLPELLNSYQNFVKFKQFISGEAFIYVLPFFLFSTPSIFFYRRLKQLILLKAIIFLIFGIPFIGYFSLPESMGVKLTGEDFGAIFAGGSVLLVLTFSYHSKKVNIITFTTILLALIINGLAARRNQVVYFSATLFFATYLMSFASTQVVRRKRVINLISAFFFGLTSLSLLPSIVPAFSTVLDRFSSGFDSREDIVEEFFEDFNTHPQDWIIGRGMYGTFKSGELATLSGGERDMIENGYLYLILKGGAIYLGLYFVLILGAIVNGFYRSKNLLCKAFASILVIHLLDMIGFGLPSYNLRYILIWLSIGGCFYRPLMKLDDSFIQERISVRSLF